MLDLPNVTLLFVETRAHAITNRVIKDCMSKVNFGNILIYTDQADQFDLYAERPECFRYAPDFPNKKQAGEFYYGEAITGINTEFALMLEWDAGIYDETKWLPEFMNYDYVGAPWLTRPQEHNCMDVGNGGFTLMSKRLGQYVHDNRARLPVSTDWNFCRTNRHAYEAAGFKWPGRDLAGKFSWELCPRDPDHFGFHGAFQWDKMLSKEEIMLRVRIMLESPYLRTKLRDVYKTAQWVVGELTPEELQVFATAVPPSHMLKPRIPGMMNSQQRAAMQLMQAHRRGPILPRIEGLKA